MKRARLRQIKHKDDVEEIETKAGQLARIWHRVEKLSIFESSVSQRATEDAYGNIAERTEESDGDHRPYRASFSRSLHQRITSRPSGLSLASNKPSSIPESL